MRIFVRYLATITNFVALGILGFSYCENHGWSSPLGRFLGALTFGNIGITLITLKYSSSSGGWLWSYFKRKTLEEQQKIEALEKQGGKE